MDYGPDIQTLHPSVSRTVVKQTEIGAVPWQRASQAESRRNDFARDTEAFCIRRNLKLSSGQPSAVQRCRQSAKIPVTKNRRIQNIDRFIVETFKDRACKISVGIDDQIDSARFTRSRGRITEYQTGNVVIDDELETEQGRYRSHIDMPPIRGERQTLEPFRTVNSP